MKKFGLLVTIVVLGLVGGGREKVRADSCVVGPGTYCAAAQCGVWYQPPNNCSQVSQRCDYVKPENVGQEDCIKATGCDWKIGYGCEPLDSNSSGLCTICNDVTQVCTCTNAYGEALPCCYLCGDGSGCDNNSGGGDDGGGSPTPTPSPGCVATYPAAAQLVSPADNSTVSGDSVVLDWNPPSDWGTGCPSNNNRYLLDVHDNDTGESVDGANPRIIDAGTTSQTISLAGHAGHNISWQVVTDNGSYQNNGSVWTFYVTAQVEGRVYLDANNTCSTAQPTNFGRLLVSLRGTSYSNRVGSNGEFAIAAPGGSYTLDVMIPNGYVCATGPLGTGCGGGCPTQTGVVSPSTGNNFFFTQKRSAWWQTAGGDAANRL